MKQYSGLLLIVLGSLILLASYAFEWVDYNFVQFGALGLMIAGLILYVYMLKTAKKG